jgi:hypothetical protein
MYSLGSDSALIYWFGLLGRFWLGLGPWGRFQPRPMPGNLELFVILIKSQRLGDSPSTTAKHSPNLTWLWPPSGSWISLDYGAQPNFQTSWMKACRCSCRRPGVWPASSHDCHLQVHLQTHLIPGSKFAQLQPPSTFTDTPNCSLHGCLTIACKCIFSLVRLRPARSRNHGLQDYLNIYSITAFKLAQLWYWSASPKWVHHRLRVYLRVHSIVIFRRTSHCPQALLASSSHILCEDR